MFPKGSEEATPFVKAAVTDTDVVNSHNSARRSSSGEISQASERPEGGAGSSLISASRFDILVGGSDAYGRKVFRKVLRHQDLLNVGSKGNANGCTVQGKPGSGLSKQRCTLQPFSHLLVCDFEATCDDYNVDYPHEIIEFPVVCVDTQQLRVVAEFHSYVRPVKCKQLSFFCKELTGITQSTVDKAPTLPEVIKLFGEWLRDVVYPMCRQQQHQQSSRPKCSPAAERKFVYDVAHNAEWVDCERMVCLATDGPWDMRKFMYECGVLRDGYAFPPLFYRWVNIRRCFACYFHTRPRKLTDMLKVLGFPFVGQQHSGIDDARNIARILIELMRRGCRIKDVSTISYCREGDEIHRTAERERRELLREEEEGMQRLKHRTKLKRNKKR
uniref:Putative exonuclease n=1 Tax=Trypanosoma congolense (strain IL3000) TaxID=1068625 RepID=G0UKH6_TRYCI|nr:putative exonuclease [Trypanosoma congolense IL3000]